MEKERTLIKSQRYLRPLTAGPKKSKTTSTKSPDVRPVTASITRHRGVHAQKKTLPTQTLKKSHLQATVNKSSESVVDVAQVDAVAVFDLPPIEEGEDTAIIDIIGEINLAELDNGWLNLFVSYHR